MMPLETFLHMMGYSNSLLRVRVPVDEIAAHYSLEVVQDQGAPRKMSRPRSSRAAHSIHPPQEAINNGEFLPSDVIPHRFK